MRLRNWAWFGIVQKTRPLIGMINIEEEIQLLENAAVNAIKESEKEASEKKRLENDNKRFEDILISRIFSAVVKKIFFKKNQRNS